MMFLQWIAAVLACGDSLASMPRAKKPDQPKTDEDSQPFLWFRGFISVGPFRTKTRGCLPLCLRPVRTKRPSLLASRTAHRTKIVACKGVTISVCGYHQEPDLRTPPTKRPLAPSPTDNVEEGDTQELINDLFVQIFLATHIPSPRWVQQETVAASPASASWTVSPHSLPSALDRRLWLGCNKRGERFDRAGVH